MNRAGHFIRSLHKLDVIRIVHLDGYVEDFDNSATVRHVTRGKPSKHFVCTPAQLLSSTSCKSLKLETRLETGKIYFLLPCSVFDAVVSPLDLASLVKMLTTRAKSAKWRTCSPADCKNGADSMLKFASWKECKKVQPWKPQLHTIREV